MGMERVKEGSGKVGSGKVGSGNGEGEQRD